MGTLCIKDTIEKTSMTGLMIQNEEFHILTINFEPPKRGQPLYKGQDRLVPRCPL